jgi:hypothetical protein
MPTERSAWKGRTRLKTIKPKRSGHNGGLTTLTAATVRKEEKKAKQTDKQLSHSWF